MFYCEDCDRFFEETKMMLKVEDDIGYQQYIEVCPFCHNDYLQETEICARCGKDVAREDIDDGMCKECLDELRSEALEFIKKYSTQEQEIIIDYLNDL